VPKHRTAFAMAAAALIAVGCTHGFEGSASGEVIDAAAAAKTVVLHVDNQNPQSMELRTVLDGRSTFAGSVGGNDSTSILLDPTMFPAGFLYVVAIPADAHGRAIAGPLAASKGDKIKFTVSPELSLSRAFVTR
jgi:hypothetical protein